VEEEQKQCDAMLYILRGGWHLSGKEGKFYLYRALVQSVVGGGFRRRQASLIHVVVLYSMTCPATSLRIGRADEAQPTICCLDHTQVE
jgi:hypothetical protein